MLQAQNTAGAAKEREHDVIEQMERLEQVITMLNENVNCAANELGPVLRVDPPTPTGAEKPAPLPIMSPLGEALLKQSRRLEELNEFIHSIRRRNQL